MAEQRSKRSLTRRQLALVVGFPAFAVALVGGLAFVGLLRQSQRPHRRQPASPAQHAAEQITRRELQLRAEAPDRIARAVALLDEADILREAGRFDEAAQQVQAAGQQIGELQMLQPPVEGLEPVRERYYGADARADALEAISLAEGVLETRRPSAVDQETDLLAARRLLETAEPLLEGSPRQRAHRLKARVERELRSIAPEVAREHRRSSKRRDDARRLRTQRVLLFRSVLPRMPGYSGATVRIVDDPASGAPASGGPILRIEHWDCSTHLMNELVLPEERPILRREGFRRFECDNGDNVIAIEL